VTAAAAPGPNEADQDPTAELAAALTPDEQLDLLDRELARRRAERDATARAARAPGGPCSRCGAVESWERPGVGGWPGRDQHGPICWPCRRDLDRAGDDHQARIRAARAVLGDTPAPAWAGHGSDPAARYWHDHYLAAAMAWWFEVAEARPGRGAERFGYLTGPELVARLYQGREPRPPTRYDRGRKVRCPSCGCKGECWTAEQVAVPAAVASTGELSSVERAHFRVTWRCVRCRHEDVERLAEQHRGVPVRSTVG
jgi:hypothetical protein